MSELIKVSVAITNISGERFWDTSKSIPPVQISTNLNLVSIEKKTEEELEVPFVLTVSYNPSVAQINMKGKAYVTGNKDEISKIYLEYKEKKPPPPAIVQSISNIVLVESVVLSRTLNIPPPIPLPQILPIKDSSERKGTVVDYTA